MTYEGIGWYELRGFCETYGLDVSWDLRSRRYKLFVWAWNWPEVGPQALGYLTLDELTEKSANEVEEFVVFCSLQAISKGWL